MRRALQTHFQTAIHHERGQVTTEVTARCILREKGVRARYFVGRETESHRAIGQFQFRIVLDLNVFVILAAEGEGLGNAQHYARSGCAIVHRANRRSDSVIRSPRMRGDRFVQLRHRRNNAIVHLVHRVVGRC